jgi:arabinogalactan endo-1,4-beta-galactosidase
LEQQVYDYTKQSIEAFKAAGVLPEMVQIGNEIAAGLLWNGEYVAPQNVNEATVGGANSGYLWSGGTNDVGFDRLATLLSACIDGARDGAGPGEEPLIMIHHDQGSRWSTTSYYFDRLLPRLDANGTDPDVLGYSYYPLYHSGGIAGVEQNLTNSARTYGKPVVVVEAGFPFRNPTQSEQNLGFPVTEAGQQAYLQAVVDAVQNVPDGLGVGVFWWYAEAQPTSGLNVWQNGRYGLFDQAGNLLDAASVFEQFIDPILPGDYNGDGIVDAADFTVWRDRLGTSFTLPNENPDAATRGVVDQEDYDYWKSSFGGNSGAESIAAAVPEPTSIVLGMIAVAFTAAPIHRLRSADSANQHRRPR